eukprot:g7006.t1
MASKTGKRGRPKSSLSSGPRGFLIEVEDTLPPPPRRSGAYDGARDQEGTRPARTRIGDDSASPESAPGNLDDDDYTYPDTDGGGDDDDDDDEDMPVAVGQAAGPIQGRAAEEDARQEELARVLTESRGDARSNENSSSGGAAETSHNQGSSSSRGASGEDVPARPRARPSGGVLMELSRCDWDDAMKEELSALWQMVDATGKVTSAEPGTPSIHAGFVGANGILRPAGFKAREQANGSLETHHLMLALPDESSDSPITLQGLLDDWTATREMSDSHCASCSQLTSSQQVTFISEAPATLVVMINRTEWIDGTGGHGGKDDRAVQFDRVASLLLRSASGITREQRYNVRGVGVHIGPSLSAGHYRAFLAGRNDTWVCADDADTTEVSWSDVSKVNPTIMVLERQQHGGGVAATHGTHVPVFWSAAVAAAGGQASGSGGQVPAPAIDDEACQPPTASAAATEAPEGKRKAELEWLATVFGRTLVADIPGRPSHVALRSASVGGKGDRDMVVQRSLYNEAVALYNRRADFPRATTCYEGPPRPGARRGTAETLIPRGVKPGTQFLRARREDAIAAIMGGIEPYGDSCDKYLHLAVLLRLEKRPTQLEMEAACPEVRNNPRYSSFFVDADGEELPVVTELVVYDNGGGADVDYDDSDLSDPNALFKFNDKVIGGAQTGGSGTRGATRRVRVGSDEHSRIQKDAAGSTVTQYVLALPLYDAFVYAFRRTNLFVDGLYLNNNVVGIAIGEGRVSLVRAEQSRTRGQQPWMRMVMADRDGGWCHVGPFPMALVVGACFTGNIDLAKWDKKVAGLEIGRGMDLSTPHAKGKANYPAEYRGEALSTNEAKAVGGHATALRGGVKGNDGRHMDNATGRSNAARPRERHWKDNAVHLPARRVWADCSTEKCKEGMWLEHFDARDHSVAVAFVHNLDGKKGDEKRCRGPPVGGKRASQGVFRPQTGKSITSGALSTDGGSGGGGGVDNAGQPFVKRVKRSSNMASSEEDLRWNTQAADGEDDDGFGEEDEDVTSRRAVGPRLSTEARQQGFPAEGMFSGAQAHPAYDSSTGQPEDDGPEQREGDSGGEREGEDVRGGAGADNNNDRSYLTQQPVEDGWSSGSDMGPPSGAENVGQRASSSFAAAAEAAAATALAVEEEAERDNERADGERHSGMGQDTAPPPSSSNGMGWDSVAAAAGGGVSEEADGGRFSHPGRGDTGVAGAVGGTCASRGRTDLKAFRDAGGVGCGSSEGDGSPLTAPSDVMRLIPAAVPGRDREAQAVIDALQEVYRKSLKPIEELSLFNKFHYDVLADADLQAKPQVLLLGQHSTGKTSMIRHFIGRDFPGMHIGPEAGPDTFQVVTAGSAERTVKGSALCILDELPYTGLGKFGAPFLRKFQASIVPSPLLEHMNFVDTPGIVATDRHAGPRGYPFPEVVKWFADRSDLILLVFDAHKLDMGAEFREVVTAIAQYGDRVRVVLNKAQEVDNDRLLKVYGALMWSISRCFGGKTAVPKVYVGSFWDGPRRHPDDRPEDYDDSFDLDEAALLREMMELPQNVGVRKVQTLPCFDGARGRSTDRDEEPSPTRAKLVKVHLQIMNAIRARMPRIWGAEAAQDRILASLEEVFDEVKAGGNVHEADLPDVEEYRRDLRRIDFRDLPRRNRRLLATLDDIVERDIKQCVTRAGGVRRFYKLDFAARIMDDLMPSSTSRTRRRATMGGSGRDRDRSRAGINDIFSGRMSMLRADDMTESSRGSDGDDEDSLAGGMDAMRRGEAEEEEHVPFVLGSWVMILVVLVGICMAAWKMEALPATMDWAMVLKPGPFPSPRGPP